MSFRTALSGLEAASSSMNTIADNLANNETTGFKSARTEFGDLVANSGAFASKSSPGIGVALQAVNQNFGQGSLGFTGNPLDLAVSGLGFFLVNDGSATYYTRNGAFGTDPDGYVINANNQRLQAYQPDANGNITGAVGDLQISQATLPPVLTTEMSVEANLDAASTAPTAAFSVNDPTSYNHATSLSIYDSLGTEHVARVYFRKTAANTWENYFSVDGAQVGAATAMTFSTSGALVTPATGTITTASFTPAGAAPMTVDIDVAGITQFGASFSVSALSQDGSSPGDLTQVEVDDTGIVLAQYDNDLTVPLGQIAIAEFTNQRGLTRVGQNNWAESFSSGPVLLGTPGVAGLGLIRSGALEGSNVDLTEELVNLIQAQRHFQANAQVISANDTLTQTILQIS